MFALTAVPALLLGAAVKGAVLVLAVVSVILFFRVRSATTRHAFWTAVVLAHLAIPALLPLLPGWHVPLPPRLASLLASLDRRSLHVTDLVPPAFVGRADVSAGPRFATTRFGPARAYGGR